MDLKNIRNKKILYVAPRYHTNQVPIMRGWMEHGCKVMFMAEFQGVSEIHDYVEFVQLSPNWLSKRMFGWIDKKYPPSQAEGKKISCFWPAFFPALKKIRQFQPDLVILRERYLTSFVIYLICRLLGISNCILYVQQPVYGMEEPKNPVKGFLKNLLFPKAVFSPVYYHGKKRGIEGNSKVWFVPLVAEDNPEERSLKKEYFADDRIHFLDIGKYRNYKNHFFLIDVFEKLCCKVNREEIKLTIIGQLSNADEKAYYEKLLKYVKEKKLEDVIEVRENIPFREMEDLYRKHDVLLLPSTYESAGMVILEAMEKGLCVAASIYCGLASYVEEYQCGYTFDLKDTEELEALLADLIWHREKISEMGQKSRKVIEEKLCFGNYVSALEELMQKEFHTSLLKQ